MIRGKRNKEREDTRGHIQISGSGLRSWVRIPSFRAVSVKDYHDNTAAAGGGGALPLWSGLEGELTG